jgi:hypothetical protein
MPITRKKPDLAKAAESFIAGAPDASPVQETKAIKKLGRKSIITLSIDPDLLARLDAWAKARGMSRAAAVSFAVSNLDDR